MMYNHVYYGEYSLAYWIELILTRKIELPKYQRHFVWSFDTLRTLIETFKEKFAGLKIKFQGIANDEIPSFPWQFREKSVTFAAEIGI